MRKLSVVLFAAALMGPGLAAADEFSDSLSTVWEVLWHQSGTPTRVVRWEDDIRVRISGVNASAYRELTLVALRAVTAEAGVKLIDVTDSPGARANMDVQITPDSALDDNQPCATTLNFSTETRIDTATIQMRGSDAKRCAHHEAMHAMGLRGHPGGKTVLSYSPWHGEGLLPLDRAMLRAWYSPRMAGGMTPLEALPVLADELVASAADKPAAQNARNGFLASTVQQMQAYANGQGDVPPVVKRAGKSTEDGIKHGRTEMSYFLGIAYLKGEMVAQDPTQATHWLQRAANAGSRSAQARLGAFR
jgi:hypothetical protein